MDAPNVAAEPMITLRVTLRRTDVGTTPYRTRTEVPFEGIATSPHWEGEWRATGIDHITRGTTGTSSLDVHTVLTNGDETVMYHAIGRGGPGGIIEGITFETASERLAWMNDAVAVGRGELDGGDLVVELFPVTL
jgi:hypothetical protein